MGSVTSVPLLVHADPFYLCPLHLWRTLERTEDPWEKLLLRIKAKGLLGEKGNYFSRPSLGRRLGFFWL